MAHALPVREVHAQQVKADNVRPAKVVSALLVKVHKAHKVAREVNVRQVREVSAQVVQVANVRVEPVQAVALVDVQAAEVAVRVHVLTKSKQLIAKNKIQQKIISISKAPFALF